MILVPDTSSAGSRLSAARSSPPPWLFAARGHDQDQHLRKLSSGASYRVVQLRQQPVHRRGKSQRTTTTPTLVPAGPRQVYTKFADLPSLLVCVQFFSRVCGDKFD